jgi:hypothetical protein
MGKHIGTQRSRPCRSFSDTVYYRIKGDGKCRENPETSLRNIPYFTFCVVLVTTLIFIMPKSLIFVEELTSKKNI